MFNFINVGKVDITVVNIFIVKNDVSVETIKILNDKEENACFGHWKVLTEQCVEDWSIWGKCRIRK